MGGNHRVVGTNVRKVDGVKLVTGQPCFTDDVSLQGMLYGRVLGSPHAHAEIESIDASQARALPGVHAVLTHEDVPRVAISTAGQNYPEPSPHDHFVLDRKVRHVGDRVAAVAAESPEIAERALGLIQVKYKVLPAVFDPEEAIRPGAPVIHDEPECRGAEDFSRNLAAVIHVDVGDVDAAFRNADIVVENEYRVPRIQHASLEPHVSIGYLDEDRRLVMRTSTQVPFHTRRQMASALQIPEARIRLIKPRIGGGFGGKQEMVLEDITGALVLATGRPVKMELRRREEFVMARSRHAQVLRMKTGAMRDGRLVANELRVVADTGAYGGHSKTVQTNTGAHPLPVYPAENIRYHCEVAYTNLPPAGAMRGYGTPQGIFAFENQMDQVAERLGMDPLELRLKACIRKGQTDPISLVLSEESTSGGEAVGRVVLDEGLTEVMRRGAERFGWAEARKATGRAPAGDGRFRRGVGMACALQGNGIPGIDWGATTIKINDDGSFNVLAGEADLGTGADTVLAQMVAETLGVGMDRVIVYSGDTDRTPFDVGAYASSTTFVSGMAAKKAAEDVRAQVLQSAGELLEARPEDLTLENGEVRTSAGHSVPLREVALHALYGEKRQIAATASHVAPMSTPPFSAQFVEVEVDTETGCVRVLRLVAAVDCGFCIHPVLAEGQVEGAVQMGLGYGLTEGIRYDAEGAVLNDTFLDYKIFTAGDMPELDVIMVESHNEAGPFGAKAVAEVPVNPPAPAIVNAVYNAVGVRIGDLPLTPEKILAALEAKGAACGGGFAVPGGGGGAVKVRPACHWRLVRRCFVHSAELRDSRDLSAGSESRAEIAEPGFTLHRDARRCAIGGSSASAWRVRDAFAAWARRRCRARCPTYRMNLGAIPPGPPGRCGG
ncbi:MAG: xanthine dehydrogenase family protein molybdopterin-binding subunit [Nitrospinota bacterium]